MAISIRRRAEAAFTPVRSPGGALGAGRIAILAGFVAVTIAGGMLGLSRSALFGPRTIDVTGVDHLRADRIRKLADVPLGADLLWLDLADVEARIEREPWVADATLHRAPPWTLRVAIVERTPVAVVRQLGVEALVAADGTIVGRARPNAALPRLVVPAAQLGRGVDASAAVASLAGVVRALPRGIAPMVDTVGLQDDGSVVLSLVDGPVVDLGTPEDLQAKAASLRRVLTWVERHRLRADAISLVSPGAPAVSLSA